MPEDLIPIKEAAQIAGVSPGYIRQQVASIPGAVLREREALRGRWYIPRNWAESYIIDKRDKAERVRQALERMPGASSSEIAREVGCSASYVRQIRNEARRER